MPPFEIKAATDLIRHNVFFPPAIVGWNRLEGRPRTAQFDRALRAEVRDPLWFLTRQWQFGEFKGEDAGSPVEVRTAMRVDPLQHYAVSGQPGIADDPAVPLETHVEREEIPLDLIAHAQVTRRFWRLIAGIGNAAAVRAKYMSTYRLDTLSGVADDDTRHALQAGGSRVLGVAELIKDIASGHHDTVVNGFASIPLTPTELQDLRDAGRELYAWFQAQYSQPTETQDDAWKARYLEYQFAVATDTVDRGQTVLVADQYSQGHLDWFAFDVDAKPGAALTRKDGSAAVPTPASVTPVSFIPTPVSFGGMPSHRYWEMESRQIEFADIDAHTTDIAKLLLTEFALVYGNDWCVIPYELPVGSLTEVVGMLVSDDFGEQSMLLPAGRGLDDRWQRWSMFTMSRSPSTGQADTRFLVPAAVAKLIEGAPLEKVHFLRDEMANMAWGVERVVPSQLGVGINGYTVAGRAAALVPAPAPLAPTAAPVRYVLGMDVPFNWIPFIPVHVSGSNRSIQLQRATLPDAPGVARARHTRILAGGTPVLHQRGRDPTVG